MEGNEKKLIRLVPETPYFNHVKVGVYDAAPGAVGAGLAAAGELAEACANSKDLGRLRCSIDVEYGEYDLKELKKALEKQGKEYNMENIREYYHDWMHGLLNRLLSSEWDGGASEGEILDIVEAQIRKSSALEM